MEQFVNLIKRCINQSKVYVGQIKSFIDGAKRHNVIVLFSVVFALLVTANFTMWATIGFLSGQVQNLQNQVNEANVANERILVALNDIKESQKKIDSELKAQREFREKHVASVAYIQTVGYNIETDLSVSPDVIITAEDMNKIIDYWQFHIGVQTVFANKGDAFIKASKETGLNPIYILAHAAVESAWGTAALGEKHNYFGINCIDSDPYNQGYDMGDSVEQGILAGAKWIKQNFYDYGCKTLGSMKRANYATDPNWPYAINSIMNQSLKAL